MAFGWRNLSWLLLLLAGSFTLRLMALQQTPFANGWDSYFYLVQLKSWIEKGYMHSPEASLVYPFFRLIHWFSGDYVTTFKWGAALLAAGFNAAAYWFAQQRNPGTAPVLGAFFLFSPQLTYFAAQYPKNLLGLILLLFLIQASSGPLRRHAAIAPVILLIVSYFGHRLCFAIGAAYTVLWLAPRLQSLQRRAALLSAVILLVLFVAASLAFPGLLHVVDMERLGGVLRLEPQFSVYSFVQDFAAGHQLSAWWLGEIVLAVLIFFTYWILWWKKRCVTELAGLGIVCVGLLFPFLEWSFTGVSHRMLLVFLLLAPLLLAAFPLPGKSVWTITVALAVCACWSWKSYNPALHDPDYAVFARVSERASGVLLTNPAELLVAHNGLAELYTFTTGTDAMPWIPEYAIDSTRLWRLAAGMSEKNLRYHAGPAYDSLISPLGARYFILPEFVWQQACRHAQSESDSFFLENAYSWVNPSRQRPQYLLRRKNSVTE